MLQAASDRPERTRVFSAPPEIVVTVVSPALETGHARDRVLFLLKTEFWCWFGALGGLATRCLKLPQLLDLLSGLTALKLPEAALHLPALQ